MDFPATVAFGIGLFTAASCALFMDLTFPSIAATQFSAFMGKNTPGKNTPGKNTPGEPGTGP